MKCCQPHLVGLTSSLRPEEVVTPIEPANWVFFAIKCRKRQFVVAWNGDAIFMFIIGIMGWWLEIWDL